MKTETLIEAVNICNNLQGHIIYDKGLKSICYSAQFLKAKQTLVDFATDELKKRGCVFLNGNITP